MPVGKSSALRLQLTERRELVVELRTRGVSYRDIARSVREQMKLPRYSAGLAHRDVMVVLKQMNKQTEAERSVLVELELKRIDDLLAAVWPKASAGEIASVEGVNHLLDRRARYLGLYAPVGVRLTGGAVPVKQEREYDPKLLAAWERFLLEQTDTGVQPNSDGAGTFP